VGEEVRGGGRGGRRWWVDGGGGGGGATRGVYDVVREVISLLQNARNQIVPVCEKLDKNPKIHTSLRVSSLLGTSRAVTCF
jgi:hypothetical protein